MWRIAVAPIADFDSPGRRVSLTMDQQSGTCCLPQPGRDGPKPIKSHRIRPSCYLPASNELPDWEQRKMARIGARARPCCPSFHPSFGTGERKEPEIQEGRLLRNEKNRQKRPKQSEPSGRGALGRIDSQSGQGRERGKNQERLLQCNLERQP